MEIAPNVGREKVGTFLVTLALNSLWVRSFREDSNIKQVWETHREAKENSEGGCNVETYRKNGKSVWEECKSRTPPEFII